MKNFNSRFLFSTILLGCLCGCFFNYEIYSFSKPQKYFTWGRVRVSSLGTEKLYGCSGNMEGPYKLVLLFQSEKFKSGTIFLDEIKVISLNVKQCFLLQKDLKKNITQKIDIYSALFQFPNLNLPFENLEVHLSFRLVTKDNSEQYNLVLLMKPEYEKHPIMFGT